MKRLLRFLPLGLGISAAIIYIMNVIQFKAINNSVATLQILIRLRTYLYISIFGFAVYFIIRFIEALKYKNHTVVEVNDEVIEEPVKEVVKVVEKPIVRTEIKEVIVTGNKYCDNCGEKIFDTDNYCRRCGIYQKNKKSGKSSLFNKVVYVLKIVILILILYFLLIMLFNFKEKQDPNFKSPFKIEVIK